MTKLDAWFRQHDDGRGLLTRAASEIGVSIPYLSRIRRGERQPGLNVAIAIERFTGGEVRVSDLVREPAPQEARAE